MHQLVVWYNGATGKQLAQSCELLHLYSFYNELHSYKPPIVPAALEFHFAQVILSFELSAPHYRDHSILTKVRQIHHRQGFAQWEEMQRKGKMGRRSCSLYCVKFALGTRFKNTHGIFLKENCAMHYSHCAFDRRELLGVFIPGLGGA